MKQKCIMCSLYDLQQILLYDFVCYQCKSCNFIVISPQNLTIIGNNIIAQNLKYLNISKNNILSTYEKLKIKYIQDIFALKYEKELVELQNKHAKCAFCKNFYKKYRYFNILQFYQCKQQNSIWIEKTNFDKFVTYILEKCKNKNFYFKRIVDFTQGIFK